jgi:cell division protein FtsN
VAAFFVQAGAYARQDDAEAQRAKLALLGLSAKITEREQSGRTVYRVRLGPFDAREEAEDAQSKLGGAGIEANLVRVER